MKIGEGILDRIFSSWQEHCVKEPDCVESYALVTIARLPKTAWTPVLTTAQKQLVRKKANENKFPYDRLAALIVAFHSGEVWSEE